MKDYKYIFKNKKVVGILFLCLFAASSLYVFTEWYYNHKIADSIFVAMLLFASYFLVKRLGKLLEHLSNTGPVFYIDNFGISSEHKDSLHALEADIRKIFSNRNSILVGLFFALLFISGILYLGIWSENSIVQLSLVLFLGVINFITGCGIYSLLNFLLLIHKWISTMSIDIWQIQSESISYIRAFRDKAVNTISIYVSICLSSIVFSVIQVSSFFIWYTLFAIMLLAIAFFLPEIEIRRRTTKEQEKVIRDFDKKIKEEYEKILHAQEINLKHITELFSIREKFCNIFKENSIHTTVSSFLSVVLITAFPVLLQILLEKVL